MSKEIFVKKEIKETEPRILKIGVDMDANVDEIDTWVCRLVKRGLGIDIREKLKKGPTNFWLDQWPEIKAHPRGPAFVRELFRRTFIYETARPVPGAVETLNKWRKQGHEIWFITARTKEVLGQVTLEWLEKNNLGWAKERLLMRQTSAEDRIEFKARQTQRLDLHFFIEDHAETVRMISSDSMINKLVLKYSWNIAEDIGDKSKFVKNWQEIDGIVQNASR